MKIAALIFGILAGLSTLPLASYAQAIIGFGGGTGAGVYYLLPLASFVGAGLALNFPAISGIVLLMAAAVLYLIGERLGYGINFITIGPLLLNGVGGALGLVAAQSAGGLDKEIETLRGNVGATAPSSGAAARQAVPYDRAKWNALVKYDPDIGKLVEKVKLLGDRWVDVFAADYLALNDKQYLPEIVRKIINDAKDEEKEAARVAALQEEQRKAREQERARQAAVERKVLEERAEWRRRNLEQVRDWIFLTPKRALPRVLFAALLMAGGVSLWFYLAGEQGTTQAPQPLSSGGAQSFTDPFAYCRAVTDIDDPKTDSRWSGSLNDTTIRSKLNNATEVTFRCMNGHVQACIIYDTKSCTKDTDVEAVSLNKIFPYCYRNPNEDVPPLFAGRSARTWRCEGTMPVTVGEVKRDHRGYFWDEWATVTW